MSLIHDTGFARSPLSRAAGFFWMLVGLVGPAAAVPTDTLVQTYEVKASIAPCLNLRQFPTTDAPILDCLPPGARVVEAYAITGWIKGVSEDGVEGWVALAYLAPVGKAPAPSPVAEVSGPPKGGGAVPRAEEPTGGVYRISPSVEPCLKFRREPISGQPLDCLPPGTRLQSLEMKDGWIRGLLDDGREGWASAGYLESAETVKPEPVPTIIAQRVPSSPPDSSPPDSPPPDSPPPEATEALEALEDKLGDAERERDLLAANLRRTKAALKQALAARQEQDSSPALEVSGLRLRELETSLGALRRQLEDAEEARSQEATALRAALAAARSEVSTQKEKIDSLEADLAAARAPMANPPVAEESLSRVVEPLPVSAEDLQPEDIELAIESLFTWAEAWSQQRVDDYLAFYSRDFQVPEQRSRTEWEEERRERIEKPSFIDLSLSAVQAVFLDPQRVSIRFRQRYRSATYEDVVLKVVVMGWEEGGWRILRENTDQVLRAP